jgi:hypothetical protein
MVGPVSQIMWENAHSTHIYQTLLKRGDQCNLLKDIELTLMIQWQFFFLQQACMWINASKNMLSY